MHPLVDTPVQHATHSALAGYAAAVDTENTRAARAALARIAQLEADLDTAREDRDRAVAAMHYEDGAIAPAIARALDGVMSVSNVRLVLIKNKPR